MYRSMQYSQQRATFDALASRLVARPKVKTTMNVPAEVAAGTKADAVDAKRAKIARIRAIILEVIVVCAIIYIKEKMR